MGHGRLWTARGFGPREALERERRERARKSRKDWSVERENARRRARKGDEGFSADVGSRMIESLFWGVRLACDVAVLGVVTASRRDVEFWTEEGLCCLEESGQGGGVDVGEEEEGVMPALFEQLRRCSRVTCPESLQAGPGEGIIL
jgi:hypothetical protein